MTTKLRTLARLLTVSLFVLPAARGAAISIDDFAVPFASPGTYVTDASGSAGAVQSPIAVLGGTRDTTITANNPSNPTTAQAFANPNPPPTTDVVHLVTGSPTGGALHLSYPQTPAFDMTFGSLAPTPSVLIVKSTLMVSGASVQVTLEDAAAGSATKTLAGLPMVGEHAYHFFMHPNAFPGVDFTLVEDITVSVLEPSGADIELSDLSLDALAAQTVNWGGATVFQTSGASGPEEVRLILGYVPQSAAPLAWDLTDPTRPTLSVDAQPLDPHRIFLAVDAASGINPCVSPDPTGFTFSIANGSLYQVVVEVASAAGPQFDPTSFFGFNPQPEPPALYGPPIGYEWEMASAIGASGPAPAGAGSMTLSFQILDAGTPLSVSIVSEVPSLIGIAPATLVALLILIGVLNARRRLSPVRHAN